MDIINKMALKAAENANYEGVTIAFLGDSVTQGCFEIYKKENNGIDTVMDKHSAYHNYVFEIFAVLFPTVPVNIINAGISGDRAPSGLARIDRDIIRHNPDLTVVCYGLNDCSEEEDSIRRYTDALEGIFEKLSEKGIEALFLTPNMMNTKISVHLHDKDYIDIARRTAGLQNDGIFDAHIEAARLRCKKHGVPVCDCYAIWKKLYESGVNTTELLANKINHPSREMNRLFAFELVRTMLYE